MNRYNDLVSANVPARRRPASAGRVHRIDLSSILQPLPFGYSSEDIEIPMRPGEPCPTPADVKDIFFLPVPDGQIVFAPLQRKALFVEGPNDDIDSVWSDELWAEVKGIAESPAVDLQALEHKLNRPGSRPTEAVFIPTERCNLRCVYCYAASETSGDTLELETALAGLQACADEVKRQGLPVLSLRFLGGGEPTLRPHLLKATTERLRELAAEIGVRGSVSMVTNGIMGDAMADWCARHIDSITVSFDGPPDVQDANRPRADGTSSFEAAARSLRRFLDGPCKADVRATVLERDLPRMTEFVRFFRDHFGLKRICLEPVNVCGRARDTALANPSALSFSDYFLRARQEGRKAGIDVEYSSAVLSRLQLKFCTTIGRQFGLNPDGSITSCSEVHRDDRDGSDLVIIGKIQKGVRLPIIAQEKVEKLRERTIDHLPECSTCFARYQCTGGCPMRAMRDTGDFFGVFRSMCDAVRGLLSDDLAHRVRSALDRADLLEAAQ